MPRFDDDVFTRPELTFFGALMGALAVFFAGLDVRMGYHMYTSPFKSTGAQWLLMVICGVVALACGAVCVGCIREYRRVSKNS